MIDCGSAITIDILDKNGAHQGGLIAPGLRLMGNALASATGLPETTGTVRTALGRDTAAAIESGASHALLGLIELPLDRFDIRLCKNQRVLCRKHAEIRLRDPHDEILLCCCQIGVCLGNLVIGLIHGNRAVLAEQRLRDPDGGIGTVEIVVVRTKRRGFDVARRVICVTRDSDTGQQLRTGQWASFDRRLARRLRGAQPRIVLLRHFIDGGQIRGHGSTQG